MSVLRQLAAILTEPMLVATVFVALALLSRKFIRCRGCMALMVAAGAIAYLSSIPVMGDFLLGWLERQHPSLSEAGPDQPVRYIVVLGSSYQPVAGWSITAELDDDGLTRIVEGIRLQRSLNIPNMALSGGAVRGAAPIAEGYAIMARSLGVDAVLTMLDQPTNTAEEAKAVAAALGTAPFILVTSAYHMPRAVREMHEQGAQPIPAPTGQRIVPAASWHLRRVLPSSDALGNTERALHEYLGILALNAGLK